MSRRYCSTTLTLTFTDPLSVGDVTDETIRSRARQTEDEDLREPDIVVAQDPSGNPVLRGTTVMGNLRAHLDRYIVANRHVDIRSISARYGRADLRRPATLADLIAGAAPDEVEDGDRVTRPSALRILSCELNEVTVHQGPKRVAINRARGAAEVHKLFQRQELGSGAALAVVMRLDLSSVETDHSEEDLIAAFLTALREWTPQMGGLTSLRYGHAEISDLKWGVLDLRDESCLAALFTADDTVSLYRNVATEPIVQAHCPEWLSRTTLPANPIVDVVFDLKDSLLISPSKHMGDREIAVTLQRNGQSVVPASSWKGVLRARAEYILRTVGVRACESSTQTCCECPTCELFGGTPPGGSDRMGNRSVLEFSDTAFDAVLQDRVHNAVDRFTGGAADKRLFTQRVAVAPARIPLIIWPIADVPVWAEPLLAMVIRDIHDGLVGIGARSNRGSGTLTLENPPDTSGWPSALAELRRRFPATEESA